MSAHGPQTDTGRIGKVMTFAAWILGLALLTWIFSGVLDWQRNPNSRVETRITGEDSREVVLKRNRQGHYIATGNINGQRVEFLLDTGATHVSVPASTAQRLALRPGPPRRVQTANGLITTYATTLDSVKLGDIELTGVAASINPHSSAREVLLGMAFLKHLELVQRGNTLTLRQ